MLQETLLIQLDGGIPLPALYFLNDLPRTQLRVHYHVHGMGTTLGDRKLGERWLDGLGGSNGSVI